MTIAEEIKRCIEVCRREGLTITVRPPPTVTVETLQRRITDKRYKYRHIYIPPIKHKFTP